MKCPRCGRQCDVSNRITSNTFACPFCGETIDKNGQSKMDLGIIIDRIKKDYGEEILEDFSRLNALLMDFAPDMAKERKLIIRAIREGVITQLRRGLEEEHEEKDIVTRKCVTMLMSEMWITENAARYAVNVILNMLGHMVESDSPPSIKEKESDNQQLIKSEASFGTVVQKKDLQNYSSIGYKAFAYNKQIIEIDIPDNIISILPKAFLECTGLKRVTLSRKLQCIGRGAFDGCVNLESIIIDNNPNYTSTNGLLIDKNKKTLVRSFNNKGTSVSITNGIKKICKKAFEKSLNECIRIPGTVAEIEEDAFSFTMKLKEINVEASNQKFRSYDGVLHSVDGKELIRYPQGKTDISYYLEDDVIRIGRKAFSYAINLSSITFDRNLKEIGTNAFEYCTGLENLMLPRGVELIGERAFQYCSTLGSVMLPQGIKRIGDCAFLGCELLKTISVPKSVTEIGNMAFAGCKALSKVIIQENVSFIGDRAFSDCPNIEVAFNNEYVSTYCKTHGIKCSRI